MIKVKNVIKTFGDFTALDNLTINVEKGSVYGLIGPNGAGQTAAFKSILSSFATSGNGNNAKAN